MDYLNRGPSPASLQWFNLKRNLGSLVELVSSGYIRSVAY